MIKMGDPIFLQFFDMEIPISFFLFFNCRYSSNPRLRRGRDLPSSRILFYFAESCLLDRARDIPQSFLVPY